MESVFLTGSAVNGILPQDERLYPMVKGLTMGLPTEVKLGRIRPVRRPRTLQFCDFFSDLAMSSPPPTSINRRDKAARSIARGYLNDRYGCCVVSGKGHAFGLWTANDTDSGGELFASDQEILDQYHQWCGPGDNGCSITNVLDQIKARGMKLGGKAFVIDGYVSADWTNKLEVQVVQFLFGATTIGINLPAAWTQNDVWDVTNTAIVGGHDVTPIDYDERGVYVSSWGRIYLITWEAFTSRRWLEEFYVLLAPAWYNVDAIAPSGVDVTKLKDALAQLAAGEVPDISPPPPPPPPPPVGAGYRITIPAGLAAGDYVVGNAGPAVDPIALKKAIDALLACFGYPPLTSVQAVALGAAPIPWGKVMAILGLVMAAFSRPMTPDAIAALIAQILAILQS